MIDLAVFLGNAKELENRLCSYLLLDDKCDRAINLLRIRLETDVAKTAAKKKITRKEYTAADIKLLKTHSKARTPVVKLAKLMKRSEGSLRQKALKLGIGLGHQR